MATRDNTRPARAASFAILAWLWAVAGCASTGAVEQVRQEAQAAAQAAQQDMDVMQKKLSEAERALQTGSQEERRKAGSLARESAVSRANAEKLMRAVERLRGVRTSIQETDLRLVVLLSRHGVRSPLPTQPSLEVYTTRQAGWPTWAAPADKPGYLTTKGKVLASHLGRFYRDLYAGQNLVPPSGACPQRGTVFFHADNEERTIQTAEGLINGFVQGLASADCGIVVQVAPQPVDPLFHPQKANVCPVDAEQAKREILEQVGGNPASLNERFKEPLAIIQDVLQCCQPIACGDSAGGTASCKLTDLPAKVEVNPAKDTVTLTGPVRVGSTVSEIFDLEYAQGMPIDHCATTKGAECVGWEQVTPDNLQAMLRVHTLYYALTQRTPAIAKAAGSNLAWQILGALEQGAMGAPRPGVLPPPQSRFVAFVGHDTNLANLGGLLGLSWHNPGFQPDDLPPAGALAFELHRVKATGQYLIRAFFVTETQEQMRDAIPLSLEHPPSRVRLSIPKCGADCPFDIFKTLAKAALDLRCVGPGKSSAP